MDGSGKIENQNPLAPLILTFDQLEQKCAEWP
jgi:hypothetical protein